MHSAVQEKSLNILRITRGETFTQMEYTYIPNALLSYLARAIDLDVHLLQIQSHGCRANRTMQ